MKKVKKLKSIFQVKCPMCGMVVYNIMSLKGSTSKVGIKTNDDFVELKPRYVTESLAEDKRR